MSDNNQQNSGGNAPDRALARIDATTGEVLAEETFTPDSIIPYSALSGLVENYRVSMWPDAHMPVHLAALEAMQITDDERLALEEAYNSEESITLKTFCAKHAGRDVRVFGIMIYEHGPYHGKDGLDHPGFYQPRILLELPNGDLQVVRTSGVGIAEHIFYALRKYGWWLFEEPLTYRFMQGESGALFMQHVYANKDDLKSRLTRKPITSSKK